MACDSKNVFAILALILGSLGLIVFLYSKNFDSSKRWNYVGKGLIAIAIYSLAIGLLF